MERIIELLYPNPTTRKDLEKIQNKYLDDFARLHGQAIVKYYRKYCSTELILEIILQTITLQISQKKKDKNFNLAVKTNDSTRSGAKTWTETAFVKIL